MKQVKKKEKRQWCNMQKTGSLLGKNTFISWFIVTVFFFFFFLSTSVALQLAKKKISAAALK